MIFYYFDIIFEKCINYINKIFYSLLKKNI